MYCNDCSNPVEYCTCGAFSRHRDSKEESQLREFFTGKKEPEKPVPSENGIPATP